ncbi:hypothetical protein D3C76_1648020 [compost metagenome]
MGPALTVDRRQVHAVGLHRRALGFPRLLQPLVEHRQRVVRCGLFLQATQGVIAAHLSQGQGHDSDLRWMEFTVC